jgi:ABC-type uncharacterized transport system involved in gliding motility auxiliary subunit
MSSSKTTSTSSAVGFTTLLVIAIVFVINYIVGGLGLGNFRVDVTEDSLYTLSKGTKNILGRINPDKPVTIRYYVSSDERVMPPVLSTYSRNVQDLLFEFQKASNDNVVFEKLTPNPDTDEEDKAREDQIQGMQVNAEGDNIYLGLAIQSGSQKEVIPFLNPTEETKLEYDVARAINKVISTKKPIIGVMSSMPVQGSPMFQFQRQRGQEPWAVIQQLRLDYEVRDVEMSATKIDSDISVLVVIHPGDILPTTEYAIDQYLLKGGRLLACVDPLCWIGQSYNGQQNPMTGQSTVVAKTSDLPNLLKGWGVGYSPNEVVADMFYRGTLMGRQNPTALQLPAGAINRSNPITESLQSMTMVSAGAFSAPAAGGPTAEILLESSEQSSGIDLATAESLRTESLKEFTASGRKKVLAMRLSGTFKTAFPDGPPPAAVGGAPGGGMPPGMPPGMQGFPGMMPPGAREGGGAQTDPAAPAATATTEPVAAAAPSAPVAPAAPAVEATAPAAAATAPAAPVTPAAPAAPAAPAGEAKTEAAPAAPAKPALPPDHVAESKGDSSAVMLFSDADMFYDAFCLSQDQMTGTLVAINSNLPMFLNAIELLSGGGDLLAVRSRASTQRPFVKLDEMREKVEVEFRPKLQSLEKQLNDTVQQIGTMKVKTDAKTRTLILDPEQQKQLADLQATQAKISKEVREVRKQQNREIDWIKFTLKMLNILLMPLIVIAVGLILAMRRRSATAAR